MKITNNSTSFKTKLKTLDVLETTSQRIFQNQGINGIKSVVLTLNPTPIKATGKLGYKHYAQVLGEKIMKKYPQIAQYTQEIKSAKTEELPALLENAAQKLGKELDIEI